MGKLPHMWESLVKKGQRFVHGYGLRRARKSNVLKLAWFLADFSKEIKHDV